MKCLLRLILLTVLLFSKAMLFAQSPLDNLHKYWLYRERLKNFVVVGDCDGCSIPAQYRDSYTNSPYSLMEWSDATQSLGLYISVLSLEYGLLKNNNADTRETTRELFYALEAFNRLDKKAERYWDSIANGNKMVSAPNYQYNKLNGFFIRDDVGPAFLDQYYEGRPIWDHLNSAVFKLPDTLCKPMIRSGFSMGIYEENRGPREESIDQVIILLQGFSLTVRFVDSTQTYMDKRFSDGEKSIAKEAKAISARIVAHIKENDWLIKNPVMPDCVQGITHDRSCRFGAAGGGDVHSLSLGVVMSNQYIQSGKTSRKDAKRIAYKSFPSSSLQWNFLKYIPIGKEDFKVLTLAALGNVWANKTQSILTSRTQGPAHYYEHIALLYEALYGKRAKIADTVYMRLLNEAPHEGASAHSRCYRWSNYGGGGCAIYGPNKDCEYEYLELPGLDYMLYFNLFAITHPQYIQHYKKIAPGGLTKYWNKEGVEKQYVSGGK